MDKKTYEALIYVMDCLKAVNNIKKSQVLYDSMKAVDDWIDEVAKEYEEDIVNGNELTDMFGEGGKEEVKEYYKNLKGRQYIN